VHDAHPSACLFACRPTRLPDVSCCCMRADNPRVAAAFLVDPVDSGGDSSSSAGTSLKAVGDTGRSAVQALAGKHKQAAIAGEATTRQSLLD
jgi:hypothetical protein